MRTICLIALATAGMLRSEEPTNDYLPLRIGNSWRFAVTAAGVERQESIVSTVTLDGATYYRFSSFAGKEGRLLRRDPQNRVWERIGDRDLLLYNFDARAGAKWSYPGGVVVLESREETITVPAGTFARCVKFHYAFGGQDGDWDEWFAPGVGPVKRVQFGYAIVDYTLESFHAEPPK